MTVAAALQSDGILRLGGMKSGFRYRYARAGEPGTGKPGTGKPGTGKLDRCQLERISTLRIPPAWRAVAIDPSQTAWVQAVGQDKAGRWQYSIMSGRSSS
jgi:DNA topoisomerase-1